MCHSLLCTNLNVLEHQWKNLISNVFTKVTYFSRFIQWLYYISHQRTILKAFPTHKIEIWCFKLCLRKQWALREEVSVGEGVYHFSRKEKYRVKLRLQSLLAETFLTLSPWRTYLEFKKAKISLTPCNKPAVAISTFFEQKTRPSSWGWPLIFLHFLKKKLGMKQKKFRLLYF